MTNFNRRRFLQSAGAVGMLGGGLLQALGAMPAHALNNDDMDSNGHTDYKALVFVFLLGGMDNWDFIIPRGTAGSSALERQSYENHRRALLNIYRDQGHPRETTNLNADVFVKANNLNEDRFANRRFAFPPNMGSFADIFNDRDIGNPGGLQNNQRDMAIVGNVGPMVKPYLRQHLLDTNGRLREDRIPARLFSHNDQQSTWMSFAPEGTLREGWGGRIIRDPSVVAANSETDGDPLRTAMQAVSLVGNTIYLSTNSFSPYSIPATGGAAQLDVHRFPGLIGVPGSVSADFMQHVRGYGDRVNGGNANPAGRRLKEDYATLITDSIGRGGISEQLAPMLNPDSTNPAPNFAQGDMDNSLRQQLGRVAQLINIGKNRLGMKRQVFFVAAGDYDTHSNQAAALIKNQADISEAVADFYTEMCTRQLNDQVTLFSGSDFGRTLVSNGDGTDHGWAGHHFVVGGAVKGKKIYGDIPEAFLNGERDANNVVRMNNFDAGNGRLIPSVLVEEYAEKLALWFGVPEAALSTIFPNLSVIKQARIDMNRPAPNLDFIYI